MEGTAGVPGSAAARSGRSACRNSRPDVHEMPAADAAAPPRDRRSARAQHERIPFGILEDRRPAPYLLLRRLRELDPAGAQLLVRPHHVVAEEGTVEEGADPVLVPGRSEQHD